MTWTLDGRPLRRILVTRLRYLGDVVMSTVVVEVLRRGDPDVVVDFLCEASHAAVLEGHPDLRRVHALGAARQGGDAVARAAADAANAGAAGGTLSTAWALRRQGYDLAVDLFFNPRSAWLLWLAGIRHRIGGTTSSSRRRLYTHLAPAPSPGDRPALYEIAGGGLGEHLCRLAPLSHDGRPFLDWFEAEFVDRPPAPRVPRPAPSPRLEGILAGLGTAAGQYVLLAPGATWPSKEWPLGHWRGLADALARDGHRAVVLRRRSADVADSLRRACRRGSRGGVLPPWPSPRPCRRWARRRRWSASTAASCMRRWGWGGRRWRSSDRPIRACGSPTSSWARSGCSPPARPATLAIAIPVTSSSACPT